MICIDCTFMSVEVLSPLHTSLINRQQLSVRNMLPTFNRCKFFIIKSYWLSILQQLSPYSYITSICCQINLEWFGVVW